MRKKLSTKKWKKNLVFYFYYFVQIFSAYNFFWVNFFVFFPTNQILLFMIPGTHIELALIDNFKPNAEETAQRNEKRIL